MTRKGRARIAPAKRRNDEPPAAIAKLGWRYHHLGVPHAEPRAGEVHLDRLGVHVCGFDTSPYGIEWMRFEPHCRVPDVVRTVPHVAFEVDDLDEALVGRQVVIEPNAPSPGVRVAFIVHDGAPVELLEFRKRARRRGRASHARRRNPPPERHSGGVRQQGEYPGAKQGKGMQHRPRRGARTGR